MKKLLSYCVVFISSLALVACTGDSVVTNQNGNNNNQQEIISEKEDTISNEGSEIVENEKDIPETIDDITDIEKENIEKEESAKEEVAKGDTSNESDLEKSELVEEKPDENENNEGEPETIQVNAMDEILYVKKNVNVRKGPSVDFNKIGSLNKGDKVHITGKTNDGWYQIEFGADVAFANSGFFLNEEAYNNMLKEEEAKALQAQEEAKKAEEQAKKAEEEAKLQTEQQQAAGQQQEEQQQTVGQQTNNGSFQSQVVALCNEKRAEAGLPPLVEDSTLDSLAQIRANEIIGYFSHTRPDGSSCFTVLDGVQWNACGENIAAGQISPEEVVNAWMNSEGHRANILSPNFGKIGIGYSTGGDYGTGWVQLFTN